MSEVLLKIDDLKVSYKVNKEVYEAVNSISFSLNKSETLGIVGEAGAGKTTTALSIMGLLPKQVGEIEKGKIVFNGVDLINKDPDYIRMVRGNLISMVFQDPMTSLNPVMTVEKQIREVLEFHNETEDKKVILSKVEIDKKVDDILELVGISPSRKREYPHQFSGGMKQRVVIAMALICNPELLIADEPTSALDVTIQAQILNTMSDLKEKLNTSMILITHDLGVVAEVCDTVAIMYAGEIVEKGTVKDIFTGDKHHPYTTGLLESIPDIESEKDRLQTIKGLMPGAADLPKGCKFRQRCKYAMDICKKEIENDYVDGSHSIKCHLHRGEN